MNSGFSKLHGERGAETSPWCIRTQGSCSSRTFRQTRHAGGKDSMRWSDRLREAGIQYSLLYPARLRIIRDGEAKIFASPDKVMEFMGNLRWNYASGGLRRESALERTVSGVLSPNTFWFFLFSVFAYKVKWWLLSNLSAQLCIPEFLFCVMVRGNDRCWTLSFGFVYLCVSSSGRWKTPAWLKERMAPCVFRGKACLENAFYHFVLVLNCWCWSGTVQLSSVQFLYVTIIRVALHYDFGS